MEANMSKKSKQPDTNTPDVNVIDPRLLEILICPLTGGPLDYDKEAGELFSKKAGLAYQIREGVPIMLADEARELK
jgi:uncharacterized protein